MIDINISVKFKTKIMDAATGNVVSETPWRKNLVLDQGLNTMIASQSIASSFTGLQVGSGTNPNSFASGGTTFTQSGTTITASGNFFTVGMVGGIFKYGTGSGGAEYYIVTFVSATQVVVDTSATVASGLVATVWQVQQTALQTNIRNNSGYITTGSSCGTTISGNVMTMQRTFVFNQQAGTYNVNEIGWFYSGGPIMGRIVLPSTDVVGPTNFYVVVMQLTATWTPSTPLAISNVGTGLNTAGTIMIEQFGADQVQSNGNSGGGNAQLEILSNGCTFSFITVTYSQNGSLTATSTLTVASCVVISGGGTGRIKVAGQRGTYTNQLAPGTLTGTGQTIYGVAIQTNLAATNPSIVADVLFTTPQTLPTGLYQPTVTWQVVYNRTLVN